MDFYHEQNRYFGQASALVYGDWGTTEAESYTYLGGAADNNRYQNEGEAMEWAPIIYILDSSGVLVESTMIKLDNLWQNSLEDHAMIDHMKMTVGPPDYIHGTMRTYLNDHLMDQTSTSETQIHVFRVELDQTTHKLTSTVLVKQITASSLGVGSYVTGISTLSGTKFGLIYFDPTAKSLYYINADLSGSSV